MENTAPTVRTADTIRHNDALWCALAAAMPVVQLLAVHALPPDGPAAFFRRLLFILTTGVLVFVAIHFRRYYGAWAAAIGVCLNLLPTVAHGGLMPASYEVMSASGAYPQITEASIGHQIDNSKGIVLREKDIHFEFLADRFYINVTDYAPNLFSVGDFFLFGGLAAVAIQAIGGIFFVRDRRDVSGNKPGAVAT